MCVCVCSCWFKAEEGVDLMELVLAYVLPHFELADF